MDKTIVIADDREQGCGVIEALEVADGVEVRIGRLSEGDYRVGDNLLFERKTLSDLAASIVQGRFFSQARRLASSNCRGVIILEGTGKDISGSGVRREAVQGALISASVLLGLAILRSLDPQETADLMLYAGRQTEKSVSGGLYRHGKRPGGKRRQQIFLLQGLPGVGPERARYLLETFDNINDIFNATLEELTQIPGIGRKTADDIRFLLREQPFQYAFRKNLK